ncbi:MAG: peptidoglycan DD-metalloendopeptidase family protein [Clostridiaceae bacterium]|nr:peptidoglycan DD-metalloendopeptidase family protein [Clostridiaceae bacterium]
MKKHIKNAGKFYAITVLILALTATVAFTAAQDKAKKLADYEKSMTVPTAPPVTVSDTPTEVNRNVTGVPDTRDESEPESTEAPLTRADAFVLPLSNGVIKDYSDGDPVYSKTMGDWRAHTGVDFVGEENEAVRAINNGKVVSVRDDALWGTVVEIDHLDGMTAKYCGLNGDDCVREGETVFAGQTVGTLHKVPVESADGTHLHLEIVVDGVYVSPLEVMGKVSAELENIEE